MECFVIQPFDSGKFDRRFAETFDPAIRSAGFTPYRVDKDPGVTDLVEGILGGIERSSAILADISLDNPNVWYELGHAIAKKKPFCIICSDERTGPFPFDISKLKIVRYKTESASDFSDLEKKIKERLETVASQSVQLRALSESIAAITPREESGLTRFEISALVTVFEEHLDGPITAWALTQRMQSIGFTKTATTLAVMNLTTSQMLRSQIRTDDHGEPYTVYGITNIGLEWITQNSSELQLTYPPRDMSTITDDDIPF